MWMYILWTEACESDGFVQSTQRYPPAQTRRVSSWTCTWHVASRVRDTGTNSGNRGSGVCWTAFAWIRTRIHAWKDTTGNVHGCTGANSSTRSGDRCIVTSTTTYSSWTWCRKDTKKHSLCNRTSWTYKSFVASGDSSPTAVSHATNPKFIPVQVIHQHNPRRNDHNHNHHHSTWMLRDLTTKDRASRSILYEIHHGVEGTEWNGEGISSLLGSSHSFQDVFAVGTKGCCLRCGGHCIPTRQRASDTHKGNG